MNFSFETSQRNFRFFNQISKDSIKIKFLKTIQFFQFKTKSKISDGSEAANE